MGQAEQIKMSCGVYMACSFFEGYLTHVIPGNGANFGGLPENLEIFEARNGVCFPVKRLFIVIPKSLYCPPDMKEFNDGLPSLESVLSLKDVTLDVAGVKKRSYRNSAYKIARAGGAPPVYLAVEFATPLHTLHKVLRKRAVYEELCDVNVQEIVDDFCAQLTKIIAKSPECRDKCVLVQFDDTDPKQNLASVLLDKIKEIKPNFEEIIKTNMELNRDE